MSDATKVDPQVIDAVNTAETATMSAAVLRASGTGKAYQSVAQSAAVAVQDATDYLRNTSTIAATAAGVALAQYLETGDPTALKALDAANGLMGQAIQSFSNIGAAAATLLKDFPVE